MGTFTMATGLGMLAFGLVVMAIGLTIILLVVNARLKSQQSEENRTEIQKQIDRIKEVRQG
tara:strand:+ start:762 stop:944 length:183 start_codon:yes stop_codon:yes gene_type:complete